MVCLLLMMLAMVAKMKIDDHGELLIMILMMVPDEMMLFRLG